MVKENIKKYYYEFKKMFHDLKNKETRKKQIPNLLTSSRLLAPLFIIPSMLFGNIFLSSVFIAGFALTDALDGHFARKYDATSEFGKELDPITDKLFAASLLIPLAILNNLAISALVFETVISSINLYSKYKGYFPKTTLVGKVKTWVLSSSLVALYLSLGKMISPVIGSTMILATNVLQLLTIKSYCNQYLAENKVANCSRETTKIEEEEKEIKKEKIISIRDELNQLIELRKSLCYEEDNNKELVRKKQKINN